MKLTSLVARNLRRRPMATVLTTLSVALGVGLFSAIGALRDASQQAFQRTAGMSNLIVGAPGSSLQLTLNTLYHVGFSSGNIPYSVYQELREERGVLWAAPTLVGDAYRGFRVVGTTDDIFAMEIPGYGKPQLADGRFWQHGTEDLDAFHAEVVAHAALDVEDDHAGHDHSGHNHHHDHTLEGLAAEQGFFVAVVGATAAKRTGLKVGSTFVPAHDVLTGGDAHEDAPTQVVGILEPTGTPLDRAIYIPGGAFYAIAGHQATNETTFGGSFDPHGVSAVMVRAKSGVYHLGLRRQYNDRLDTQGAWPIIEVGNLFKVVGNIDSALRIIAALVIVVALVGVLVALSNTMAARQKEFAVLRALGARRRTVLTLVVAESSAIAAMGGILGIGLSAVGLVFAAAEVEAQTGVSLTATPGTSDLVFLAAVTVVGALAGLIPAQRAYRTEAARALSSSL